MFSSIIFSIGAGDRSGILSVTPNIHDILPSTQAFVYPNHRSQILRGLLVKEEESRVHEMIEFLRIIRLTLLRMRYPGPWYDEQLFSGFPYPHREVHIFIVEEIPLIQKPHLLKYR
jgi:hypothetical protein